MDLDGDGIPDILSGSWPGELYFFKGQGKGQFAAGVKLKDRDGQEIKLGSASTVFAVDWNGDGKLDLLIGCIEGHVWLVLNEGEGDGKTNKFGPAVKLEAGGQPIVAPHGDSHPVAADWDKDGKLDLVLGCGDGSVVWYRNVGTGKEPKLAAAQTLVPPAVRLKDGDPGPKDGQPGMRAKVCVVDWNGDGWPDLLVGDFGMIVGQPPKMTDEDKAKKAAAEKQLDEFYKKMEPLYEEVNKLTAPPGETPDEAKKRLAKITELKEKIHAAFNAPAIRDAQETIQRYQPPYTYTGYVWLYLRQPAK